MIYLKKYFQVYKTINRVSFEKAHLGDLTKLDKVIPDYLNNIRPFVFDYEPLIATMLSPRDLNLPFPVCSLEIAGDFIVKGIARIDGMVSDLACVLIREFGPNDYDVQILLREKEQFALGLGCSLSEKERATMLSLCAYFFDKLRSNHVAAESVGQTISVKVNGRTHTRDIRQVVHVTKNKMTSPRGPYGGPLDHSHRWEVSGHWRSIRGIGKDRYGSYGMKGSTWVVPHVKGPEEKPIIRKQRVVHATEGLSHAVS